MVRTPAVGAAVVAAAAGAALLAGPLATSQASEYAGDYYNGAFCYQNPDGQENTYRIQVTEIKFNPNAEMARFSFQPQKWDGSSDQYRDDAPAFESVGLAKYLLQEGGTDGKGYTDPGDFCRIMTENSRGELGGDIYSYGVWTSRRAPASAPTSSPTPSGA
jgi:hypothetical protein